MAEDDSEKRRSSSDGRFRAVDDGPQDGDRGLTIASMTRMKFVDLMGKSIRRLEDVLAKRISSKGSDSRPDVYDRRAFAGRAKGPITWSAEKLDDAG